MEEKDDDKSGKEKRKERSESEKQNADENVLVITAMNPHLKGGKKKGN